MKDCLFCKIIKEEIPSDKVFENETVIGFRDINPSAKIHNLFIHKNHSHDVSSMTVQEIKEVFESIQQWVKSKKLNESGFRIVTNCGEQAGQSVFHTHFHVLGGENLKGFGAS